MEVCENAERPVKKNRARKKQLYNDILKQMEFYFSDANLTKDRYITKILEEKGSIDVSLFLSFNKIRALTTEQKDLVKALRRSELIELDEENMVLKRVKPIVKKENEEDCIIYIENLPPDADHDWLKDVFSSYGQIDYISLPRYKNGKLKGFCFIEFANAECVDAVVKDYKKAGSYLSTEMAPEELCSISVFSEQNMIDNSKTKNATATANGKMEVGTIADVDVNNQASTLNTAIAKTKKRKKPNGDSPIQDETGATVQRENGNKETEDKSETNGEKRSHKKKKIEQPDEEISENVVADQPQETMEGMIDEDKKETNEEIKKKKNRKKKNKPKKYKITAESSGLQILCKRDWKRLRNKYLNTQKDKMKLLKKHLSQPQFKAGQNKSNFGDEDVQTCSNIPAEFTPGLIVKINLPEPVIEVKRFKDDAKSTCSVKYIDVKEGASQVYFRFDSADSAQDFMGKTVWSNVEVIKGEEEVRYWQKIQTDRTEKLQKSKKVKERGKTKLLKKAEKVLGKRIVFEGLDNE